MKPCFLILLAFFMVCVPVFAHHGNTAYDTSKVVVLKGATVTKYVWANPHVIITFDVKDDKGNVQHWSAEAGTPQTVILAGWSKTSVAPGDVITVYIFQAKTGNPVGRLNKIVLADGTELKDSALGYRETEGEGKQ
ncbi:MAG TPA: DUF6152 family protein [Bryobacteraceae bacterium]|nr:DUF6152 family protein [Bryobacteraceae bacterium]